MFRRLPKDFNSKTYLRLNPDVAASGMDAADHYWRHGRKEGRKYLEDTAARSWLAARALEAQTALEIGPFCNPVLIGANVKYFDIMDKAALIARAEAIDYPVRYAPDIDFVSPIGDLSIVNARFDAVLSAHCIEHQPDLIAHLLAVSNLLNPGGRYYLIIPDKRYCFDATLDVSNLAEVIAAHVEGRKVHSLASVIEHTALTTHNDAARHWRGDHLNADYDQSVAARMSQCIEVWKNSGGGYIDVHAWQFTPNSFSAVMTQLNALGYIDLSVEMVNETPSGLNEFTAILGKQSAKRTTERH